MKKFIISLFMFGVLILGTIPVFCASSDLEVNYNNGNGVFIQHEITELQQEQKEVKQNQKNMTSLIQIILVMVSIMLAASICWVLVMAVRK